MVTGYCKVCKKEVDKPIKKPIGTLGAVLWGLIIFATLGIALIIYLPYRFRIVKKKHCPTCYTLLDFKKVEKEEEIKPQFDTSTAKGKVLEKVEKVKATTKEKKGEKEYYCPFCGAHISPKADTCPACKTTIK
ncbi:MAG: hypothetical protein ACFFBP_04130 [Promethearchaeota archaeon]